MVKGIYVLPSLSQLNYFQIIYKRFTEKFNNFFIYNIDNFIETAKIHNSNGKSVKTFILNKFK